MVADRRGHSQGAFHDVLVNGIEQHNGDCCVRRSLCKRVGDPRVAFFPTQPQAASRIGRGGARMARRTWLVRSHFLHWICHQTRCHSSQLEKKTIWSCRLRLAEIGSGCAVANSNLTTGPQLGRRHPIFQCNFSGPAFDRDMISDTMAAQKVQWLRVHCSPQGSVLASDVRSPTMEKTCFL